MKEKTLLPEGPCGGGGAGGMRECSGSVICCGAKMRKIQSLTGLKMDFKQA
jgi:hypothetical protein